MSQRPYLPSGSLRQALCYPLSEKAFATQDVADALRMVGLDYLQGLLADGVALKTFQLSPGEQQLVALARAVLQKPEWLFLDEATASLDAAAESRFYEIVARHLPNTSVVSITHRGNVDLFYNRVIDITRQGTETRPPIRAVVSVGHNSGQDMISSGESRSTRAQ
jgi:putative ATP-binding cassette transporter